MEETQVPAALETPDVVGASPKLPSPGDIQGNYKFLGGDPAKQESWQERVRPGTIQDGYRFVGGDPAEKNSWQPTTEKPEDKSNIAAGFKNAFMQLPQLAHGIVGALAATVESAAGEGGMATATKDWAVKGYQDWGKKIADNSKDNYDWDVAWDKAYNQGNPSALMDWAGNAFGYTLGQAGQMLLTGGVGSLIGKAALKETAVGFIERSVAKETEKILAKGAATGITKEAAERIATKKVAGEIGEAAATGASAFGMEAGEIGGDLAESTKKDGQNTVLTGSQIAKGFTATLLAGTMEFGDRMLGLKAMQGKLPVGAAAETMPGFKGRVARGLIETGMAAPVEFGTEYGQTMAEEYGKGNDPFSDETRRQALNAGALGAMGGSVHGMGGGLISAPRKIDPIKEIETAPDVGTAIDGMTKAVDEANADLSAKIDAYVRPPSMSTEDVLHHTNGLLADLQSKIAGTPEITKENDDGTISHIPAVPGRALTDQEQAAHDFIRENADNPAELAKALGLPYGDHAVDPATAAAFKAAEDASRPKMKTPFSYSPDLQGNKSERPESLIPGTPEAFLAVMEQTNTPAAQAFVRDYKAGRLSDTDVKAAMDAGRATQPTPTQVIEAAANEGMAERTKMRVPFPQKFESVQQGILTPPSRSMNAIAKTQQPIVSAQQQLVTAPFAERPKPKMSVPFAPEPVVAAAPEVAAPEKTAQPEHYGINHIPLSDGGKRFKTREDAAKAKKLQPLMRVVKVRGGFALTDKTPAQLAAQEKASARLKSGGFGSEPQSAHEFIAANGGLSRSEAPDLGVEGNPRVGRHFLFASQGRGMSIEHATEMLQQAGYIDNDSHNSAYDVIRRSLKEPQYSQAGWEDVAQKRADDRVEAEYQDYLAAQKESATKDDFDPFASLEDAGFDHAEPEGALFDRASPELQAEVAALANQLSALGHDSDTILESLSVQNENATEREYYESARNALTGYIADATEQGSRRSTGENARSESNPSEATAAGTTEGLTNPTKADLESRLARLEQAEKDRQEQDRKADQQAKADQSSRDFGLTGSNREADQAAARGQQDLLAPTKQPTPSNAPISDFGEKVGGARKDVWAEFGDRMTKVSDDEIAAEPLSKSWPEPNYEKLLETGADSWAVGFMHAARDAIPAKPRQPYKVKRWAEQVKMLRTVAIDLADGKLDAQKARKLISESAARSPSMYDMVGRIELYQAVGHSKSLHGVKISVGEYGVYESKTYSPPKTIWSVEKQSSATAFGNWPRMLATGDTKAEAIENFKSKFDSMEITKPTSKDVSFDIYSTHGEDGYRIGKKVGRNIIPLAGPFATVKEARAYRTDNQSELVSNLEKAKEIPRERRDTNNPRVGEDMRNAQDVTPEMFADSFGFRGVEFGNWVEQGKRQKDLNDAYDALMDMAAILEIPPRSLSLNGELSLAFGARGTGGKGAAAAHYEPARIVINLTKKEGAGSLGHEWWHALDGYFARMRSGDHMTDALDVSLAARGSNYMHKGAVRKEMVDAFGEVMKSIRQTAIKARSSRLDSKRTKEYWTTDPEMSARAYESYLISKLQDQNASNDYLANIVSPETWAAAEKLGFELDESYPYPTAGEMPLIRAGFDKFFQTIDTRETDKGIALFSRQVSQPSDQHIVTTDAKVSGIAKDWHGTVTDDGVEHNFKSLKIGALSPVYRAIEQTLRAFGKKLIVFKSDTLKADGFVHPGERSTVYLNVNSTMSPLQVAFHELTHLLEADNPEIYNVLSAIVTRNISETGAYQYRNDIYGNENGPNSNAELTRSERNELIADLMGSRAGKREFLTDVFEQVAADHPEQSRGIIARFAAALRKTIRAVIEAIKQPGFKAEAFVKNLDEVREALKSALVSYAKAQRIPAMQMEMETMKAEARINLVHKADAIKTPFAIRKSENEMQRSNPRGGNGVTEEDRNFAAEVLTELAGFEDAFRFRKSESHSLLANLKNSMNGVEFLGSDLTEEDQSERNLDKKDLFKTPDGDVFHVYQRGNDVWIDVHKLHQGKGGSAIYHAVANYAYNTGKTFVGDPAGLSPDAIVRRTIAMLSSALRFGTTKHFQPANEQLKGIPKDGIMPLKWGGTDYENLKSLIDTFLGTANGKLSSLLSYKFDAGRNEFVDDRGRPVGRGRFSTGASSQAGRAARMGPSDLRRAILLNTLLSSDGSERPGLLEDFLQRSPQLVRTDALRGIFSRQRQTETPEFKQFFGDSKVVDDNGDPIVVYHNTNSDFTTFDGSKDGSAQGYSSQVPGFWFAQDERVAGMFGKNQIASYLSIQNPKYLTAKEYMKRYMYEGRNPVRFRDKLEKQGFDGLIITPDPEYANGRGPVGTEEWGQTNYVAFRPEQIKSATGNNGNFDGTNPDITKSTPRTMDESGRAYTPEQQAMHRNIGRTVDVPSMKEKVQELRKGLGMKLAQGIVDQFAPIKQLSQHAYALARLSKGAAGAIEAFLKHGKLSIADGVYDADNTGGVIDRLGVPLHGEMGDFLTWVAGNRAERLMAEGKENLFTPADIAAAKSLADGKSDFDYTIQHGANAGQVTRDRTLIYADSLKTFNEFNKNALDIAEQSGLIDKDSRKMWENEFYVPFYRVSEDGGFVGGKGNQSLIRQQAFKALKGGSGKLNSDLLNNTLQNWAHLIEASAKNRAAKATLDAAAKMGVAVEADESTARQIGKSTGLRNNVVWYMDDGKHHYFVVEDPHVLAAITSLEFAGLRGPLMNGLSAFKHWLTVGVTASPIFKVRNLIRDSIQAIGTSDLGYNMAGNLAQGWNATKRDSQTYISMLASGAHIRFGAMMDGSQADHTRRLIKNGVEDSSILDSDHKVKNFVDKFISPYVEAYNELGSRGEEINRAALYQQLRDQGMSHAEASLAARDLMDFSMQGSWTTVRFLTQVVPFMNARLQGLYKLGRAAKEDPAKFAAVLGATALFSVALLAKYADDDDWKKREDWDRDNYWWFKVGGTAFRIPKPFEIGAIATLAERGLEYFISPEMTGERFRERVLSVIGNNLNMNPIPQAVKPILDIYSNKDSFSGRPIETMGMEKLRPDYRFTQNTTMTARAISTAGQAATSTVGMDFLSPVQVDHVIQGYFSWLGTFVVGAGDMLIRPLTNEASRPAPDWMKVATRNMVSSTDMASSRYVSQMYDQAKILEEAYGTYRMLLKEGRREEAQAFMADHKDELAKYKSVEHIKQAEAKLNERQRMIERSALDSEEKRIRIMAIRDQKDAIARRVAPGYR